MRQLCRFVVDFLQDESGPTSVEYAINLALIVVFCVSSMSSLSSKATKSFNTVSNVLSNTTGS